MKKTINMPEVRVISFESHDVIATSSDQPNNILGNQTQLTEERRTIWD